MAEYKVEVDLSDLFDDMTINEQKNFLVDKFCSLLIDKMVEVVGEMLENLRDIRTAKEFIKEWKTFENNNHNALDDALNQLRELKANLIER